MFFIDDVKTGGFIAEFPLMVGLQKMEVATTTDDDPSTWRFSVQQALSLESLPFIAPGPPRCSTFSKCVRKGKEVELSGTESFFGLVLPLLKSLQYFERTRQPLKTFMYFDLHAALAVGVLDAPMVGVRMASGNDTYELLPWVRVMRHETKEDAPFFERD